MRGITRVTTDEVGEEFLDHLIRLEFGDMFKLSPEDTVAKLGGAIPIGVGNYVAYELPTIGHILVEVKDKI